MELTRGQLRPEHRRRYVLGGDATFTLESSKTKTRYTYQVERTQDNENKYFVRILTGPDNGANYTYAGLLDHGAFRSTAKSRVSESAPSVVAFKWWLGHIESELVNVWHEGKCGVCGRKLTVPESVETGIGPKCAGRN